MSKLESSPPYTIVQAFSRTDGDEDCAGPMVTLGGGALATVAEGSLGSLASPNPAETPQTLQQQQKKKKGKKKGQRG